MHLVRSTACYVTIILAKMQLSQCISSLYVLCLIHTILQLKMTVSVVMVTHAVTSALWWVMFRCAVARKAIDWTQMASRVKVMSE